MTRRYAEGTAVSVSSSQAEIRKTLQAYGVNGGLAFGEDDEKLYVMFRAHDRNVRFLVRIPPKDAVMFTHTPSRQRRSPAGAHTARLNEIRRLWRCLNLAIKSKLEVVASGIATFEEEFLHVTVLPSGRTVAEELAPAITAAIESGAMPTTLLQIEG